MNLTDVLAAIRPLDQAAMAAATHRQARLTKPAGSLGALEDLAVRLAGLAGVCPPPVPRRPVVAVFAGDHGVHAQGVTRWPQEVTAQMVANFLAGGAVVNAFARQVGAAVTVVDVGVAAPLFFADQRNGGVTKRSNHANVSLTGGQVRLRKVRAGTRNFAVEPALTRGEAIASIEVGVSIAEELVAEGYDALLTGDMGIANTTPAAALIAAYTGARAAEVTGRGTGIDDVLLARKVALVAAALARHRPDAADAVGVLAAVGGLEHGALAGFILGGVALRVPVILDGVIACSAALAAAVLAPDAVGGMVAGHLSPEPGAAVALRHLGLRPLIDLGLRLGEGTGALLALPIVASAVRVLHDVATFDAAGVSERGTSAPPGGSQP
jgi:nicotinate-nucleotide--dimethylbenzimidazole phosphoribosyltransferase